MGPERLAKDTVDAAADQRCAEFAAEAPPAAPPLPAALRGDQTWIKRHEEWAKYWQEVEAAVEAVDATPVPADEGGAPADVDMPAATPEIEELAKEHDIDLEAMSDAARRIAFGGLHVEAKRRRLVRPPPGHASGSGN